MRPTSLTTTPSRHPYVLLTLLAPIARRICDLYITCYASTDVVLMQWLDCQQCLVVNQSQNKHENGCGDPISYTWYNILFLWWQQISCIATQTCIVCNRWEQILVINVVLKISVIQLLGRSRYWRLRDSFVSSSFSISLLLKLLARMNRETNWLTRKTPHHVHCVVFIINIFIYCNCNLWLYLPFLCIFPHRRIRHYK